MNVMENGVACDPNNPALKALIEAVDRLLAEEPRIGKKLPGTSARFAPGGRRLCGGNRVWVHMRKMNGITFRASSRITDR